MIHEFFQPLEVVTKDGKEGFAIYIKDGGNWNNDCFCVVLKEGGLIRHYLSDQIAINYNATYGIKKIDNETDK